MCIPLPVTNEAKGDRPRHPEGCTNVLLNHISPTKFLVELLGLLGCLGSLLDVLGVSSSSLNDCHSGAAGTWVGCM